MFRVAIYIEHVQRPHDAVEHILVANGHPGLLFCHPQLTGVLFPAAQNLDFLIAGKLNVGNDILWILEHHHGIQASPYSHLS